ncbi:hypothetical protein N0V90_007001 [Kalmusia sp. IMI 367209]|nr:hypothetical protein N0V90_007001 [Kalmusia sp. IMI 367209]
MVSLRDVLSSNARIKGELPPRLVAVFAGATTGIGEATLKTFVKYAVEPRIYFFARNPTSAERVVAECKIINAQAQIEIIKADLSLVRDTDRACDVVKAKETSVNLVFMSMGEVRLDRALSPEGLHHFMGTVYYNRIRIPQNLLPLLVRASTTSPLARVLDVAGGTKEGYIDTSDISALRIPFRQIRPHLTSMHTLALESLADQAPTVSFVHDFPGAVLTPLYDEIPGLAGFGMRILGKVLWLFSRWMVVPLEESGERHVFLGTSAKYPPGEGDAAGVGLADGMETNKTTDRLQCGVYSVDWDCEGPGQHVIRLLKGLRENGVKEKVWEHTNSEFERITNGK